ncbi:FxsA family protein [Psychrobacter sp.]|uniref:FxsA family protein n=1 Tax=Psychrobacter sp. TaxID=56811 RepID=UPI0026011110|nr:FxsA family protein [Psychrobacter sp.]
MGQVVGLAIVWFIIEMLLWYLVAQFISGWWVFFWFIIAAVIGLGLIRRSMTTLNPMAQQMKAGGMMNPSMRPPENKLVKTIAMAVGGLLLLIPGILSDILALLVVLPPVQKKLKGMANNYVMNNQQKMMQMMAKQMGGQMGGQNPFGGMGVGGNPFGTKNPFENKPDAKNANPFGKVFKHNTTVDGSAKTVVKDVKKLNKPANDE